MPLSKQDAQLYKIVTSDEYLDLIQRIDDRLLYKFPCDEPIKFYLSPEDELFTMQLKKDYELAGWRVEIWVDGEQHYLRFS